MPFVRRARRAYNAKPKSRTFKRRRYGGRKRFNARQGKLTRQLPFPSEYFTKLRYAEFGQTLASVAGVAVSSQWRLNSLYDPRFAVGGGQPRWFDSLCGADGATQPYRQYMVTGCKAIVTFNNYSTGIGSSVAIGYRPSTSTAPNDIREAMERANYKVKDLAYYAGGPTVRSLSMYIPINKIFGISRRGLLDDIEDYGAFYNADPVAQGILDVFYQPTQASTSTMGYSIKLIYYCKFMNRNDVADS